MKDISRKSMDKLDSTVNSSMKTLKEVAEHEMRRSGLPISDRDLYDNFKTFCLLYISGIINNTITNSNAILLGDKKTENKEQ